MARSKLSRVMEVDPEDFEPEGSMFDDEPEVDETESEEDTQPE